jgi:hypothetical protein
VIVSLGDNTRACRPTALGPCSINDMSFALHRVFISDQANLTNFLSRRKSGPGAGDPMGLINLKFGYQSLCRVTSKNSETLKAG